MQQAGKVYSAINKVQCALAAEGISKSRRNQQQGYSFRGIDDIYNAISSLLGEHGLCILPRVLSRDVVERQTAKGGVLFYVTVDVEFDFVSAEDGSRHTVKTYGEAMDSADKATNKAMSAAYKYAVMQAFAIPTEGDNDADAITHDVTSQRAQPMSENAVIDHLAAISGSGSLDELKNTYGDAYRAAKASNDSAALEKFERAKEVRKSELAGTAATA